MSEVEMLGPLDIHQHLLAHDIRHEIVRVRRPAPTSAQLPEALGTTPERCVLAHLFVVTGSASGKPTDEKLVLALATADIDHTDQRFVDSVSAYLTENSGGRPGRRNRKAGRVPVTIEPAAPELVSSRTDYLASQLAPLLMPADVLVVAVPHLAELGTNIVYTAAGDGGTALALRAIDLIDASGARMLRPTDDPDTIVLDRPIETSTSRLAALSPSRFPGAARSESTRTPGPQPPAGRRALRSTRASWTPTEQS